MSTTTTTRVLPSGTVYYSLSADSCRDKLRDVFSKLQPNLKLVDVKTSMQAIKFWESTKGNVPEEAVKFDFRCFVSYSKHSNSIYKETGEDTLDPAVMYALHEAKIPVLRLLSKEDYFGQEEQNSKQEEEGEGNNNKKNSLQIFTHPLLESVFVDSTSLESVFNSFFTFPAESKTGKVIVIEGGDGAGKQTQTALLLKKLAEQGQKAQTIDFPHDAARYGVLIREILAGHKGPLKEVSPLVFASLYGLNRHDMKAWISNWLLRGTHVVFDRWMTANYGHQASKLKTDEERDAAIAALRAFEVKWLGLPEADRVLYLDLPPEVAYRALLQDTTRKELDLHEKAGIEYKENVRRAFIWCCERFNETWTRVKCCDEEKENARLSRDQVQEQVWNACKTLF